MYKIIVVLGTRPEAIKLSPVILKLKESSFFDVRICITGQHKEMLHPILSAFEINVDYDLNVMRDRQNLLSTTVLTLSLFEKVFKSYDPDMVIVQGDTIATYVGALTAFLTSKKLIHIEAGLRTGNLKSPFPEEFFRRSVTLNADFHFSPSKESFQNLINEGVESYKISIVGNTGIDTLKSAVTPSYKSDLLEWASDSKLILMSTHRRENLYLPMENIFKAISSLLITRNDIKVIFPIHKNPIVRELADKHLKKNKNLKVIEPLDFFDFQNLLASSYLVMTDSGGIQEEVCFLGIPTLVLRDTTERPEGVQLGNLLLTGTNIQKIVESTVKILDDKNIHRLMSQKSDIYGDGNSSQLILDKIIELVGIYNNTDEV